jgi:putative transposase
VVDVYVESRRKGAAARQFFKRLLRNHDDQPRTIVTDKLASYRVAQRELMPKVHHNTVKYVNNRAEQLHESTRFRERGMRRFKFPSQAQLFLTNDVAVSNLLNLGRHLVPASHY